MLLKDIKIVLCNVADSGNTGAVCRAMKNMGLSGLRLANPEPLIIENICSRAVNSLDIWENARIYDNLAAAIADCAIVIGTTRRRGNKRKNISMAPRALAGWLAERQGPAAIVFGNERTGLSEEQLNLCNIASHIPVSDDQPSLNLSHAVQIYAYEFFLAMEKQKMVKGEWTAISQNEINGKVSQITEALQRAGFYKKPGREAQERFFRDLIARAGLSKSEAEYFKEIIVKAAMVSSRETTIL
ncbi:MAG: TrmJ/YjtD family RNA methyltransferase [Treponema sp.]|nr:TrmJ/YjtD family RNA methyltransferase [Treponema sp.]